MVKLIGTLSQLQSVNILVVGDLMLDIYTRGKVERISPEAPVSILHVQKEDNLPGGSGNVLLNLLSLGAKVSALGRVGNDFAGERLRQYLFQEGVVIEGIFVQEGFKTPVKNRFIAEAQQVLRVDFEQGTHLPESLEQTIIEKIPSLLEGIEMVAISDYGKGFLSLALLRALIDIARSRHIPVVVDPKGDDFSKYQGATVLKPNLHEAYRAAKLSLEAPLEQVAARILESTDVDKLLITRSEQGISVFDKGGGRADFPVRSKEVKDVTGAGDTVLALIAFTLANGLEMHQAAALANVAAGIAIEHVGCVRVGLAELASRLWEFDVENKVFDEQHLFALQCVLKNKRYTLLSLESHQGISTLLFSGMRAIHTAFPDEKILVYIRDEEPQEEFIALLASLKEVDFIVLHCESLKSLSNQISPQRIYSVEGENLLSLEDPSLFFSSLQTKSSFFSF